MSSDQMRRGDRVTLRSKRAGRPCIGYVRQLRPFWARVTFPHRSKYHDCAEVWYRREELERVTT